jgi:hypothetical protein
VPVCACEARKNREGGGKGEVGGEVREKGEGGGRKEMYQPKEKRTIVIESLKEGLELRG